MGGGRGGGRGGGVRDSFEENNYLASFQFIISRV